MQSTQQVQIRRPDGSYETRTYEGPPSSDLPAGSDQQDDPLRGTGRTTGLMLVAIGTALLNQGKWVDFQDHAIRHRHGQNLFAAAIAGRCRSLGLVDMEVVVCRGRVQIRSMRKI